MVLASGSKYGLRDRVADVDVVTSRKCQTRCVPIWRKFQHQRRDGSQSVIRDAGPGKSRKSTRADSMVIWEEGWSQTEGLNFFSTRVVHVNASAFCAGPEWDFEHVEHD